jgi:hypothetical protein
MRPRLLIALLCLVCLSSTGAVRDACAQSWFTVDLCDTVSINGQSYDRVTFSVHNIFQPTDDIWVISMAPQTYQVPGDTCRVIQLTAPLNWKSTIRGDGGPGWIATSSSGVISPGQTQSGFQMVLRHPTCCYFASFTSVFDTPFASATGCFACALPTPALGSSWGQLKVKYR